MPFRNDGTRSNDNGTFRSISDCTPDMEKRAVVSVFRHCSVEDRDQVLEVLGLTGTAAEMLATRARRLPRSEPEPRQRPADLGS